MSDFGELLERDKCPVDIAIGATLALASHEPVGSESGFNGRPSLVVTSVSEPNAVLRELAAQCKARGLSFFLAGDAKSPANFALDGCEYYDLSRQRESGFRLAELLPTGHYARKNVAYLLAMQSGARQVIETDDDNMPLPGFWEARKRKQRIPCLSGLEWANVYAYFSDEKIWPRGLPLDAIRQQFPEFDALPEVDADCPIQQGLADGNPDVDAIYRLILPLPIEFRPDRSMALGTGTWCPFNSQNTTWFPDAYPLLYLPSHCSFRMTDIWRSFVAQRIAWENGWSILFRSPDVVQERNEHKLISDFEDEVAGYLHNRFLAERLGALKLKSGVENLGEDLLQCYEELVRVRAVGGEEMELVKAWVEDISFLANSRNLLGVSLV